MQWFCVLRDGGLEEAIWTAHGYDTEAEATAFDDGIEFAGGTDLSQRGIHQAETAEDAIQMAKAASGDDEDDESDADDGEEPDDDDDGCPKNDPDCLGGTGDCHDACEWPKPPQDYFQEKGKP